MLEVISSILIEIDMKSDRLERRARGHKKHFDREGHEKVTVWSPVLEVISCILIERGVKK